MSCHELWHADPTIIIYYILWHADPTVTSNDLSKAVWALVDLALYALELQPGFEVAKSNILKERPPIHRVTQIRKPATNRRFL